MCGLTGKIVFDGGIVSRRDILLMNEKVRHRGPDDEGIYISSDQKVGLGHRRLSIIDLSPQGHQPMNYMDRYWIVYNGEIYNFLEKRKMLESDGYVFRTHSDTEVVLALYDKYERKCVYHLRGMFAFAIYDEVANTVFCARDRIGKKPFKYYLDENTFIFASEIKAILTQKEYRREPDYIAIHHYLSLQYCPSPLTGFKNIKKLEPAHYLFLDLKNKKVEEERYWQLNYSRKMELPEHEWESTLISKLEESVRLRMISDVPLGAFLSGGIDSSAVVGIMTKFSSKPVKTFSIGFEEKEYNELYYARLIAKKFETDHQEFTVRPDTIEVLPMLVRQYEEPYADPSALPTFYLSKLTRDYVTVSLTGDGGDENFAGYPWYRLHKMSLWYERYRWLNTVLVLPMATWLTRMIRHDALERVRRIASSMTENHAARYLNSISYFTSDMKAQLYSEQFNDIVCRENTQDIIAKKFFEARDAARAEQALSVDVTTYLPDDLLAKVDIAGMMVALECRAPFLDHEFMEMAATIPYEMKLKGLNKRKHILKKALKGFIPDEILFRKKMGFGVPLDRWFRNDLKAYSRDILLSGKATSRGLFKKAKIEELLDAHTKTQINYANKIWAILTLELWFREYFDAPGSSGADRLPSR